MGKTFKSPIATAYGSNMNHIANYGNSLPSRKKDIKKIENVSGGSLNSKYELAKKYFIYNFRELSTSKICTQYKLNAKQAKELYDMLKEFRKEFENNKYGTKEETILTGKPVRIVPTLKDRLENIRIRYLSEDRSRSTRDSIPEGFVYLVENPAWPGWVKIGMTMDYEQRLSSYNSAYDPYNKYSYIEINWVKNRRDKEADLLELFENKADDRNGEWFRISKSLAIQLFSI